MTVAGDEVTAVDVEVDLTTLQSDSGTRDGALRSRGLESDEFPTATFSLTEPLALPAGAADGERGLGRGHRRPHDPRRDAAGHRHGRGPAVGRPRRWSSGQAPVLLADFGIEPPTGFSVLSIKDEGTFEFQIFFTKG